MACEALSENCTPKFWLPQKGVGTSGLISRVMTKLLQAKRATSELRAAQVSAPVCVVEIHFETAPVAACHVNHQLGLLSDPHTKVSRCEHQLEQRPERLVCWQAASLVR